MKDLALKDFELQTFDITKLPFFNYDDENNPPQVASDFKNLVEKADAILFITPEYNRSFPGVLKNAIDWASRPYGQSKWKGKKAAVMGASIGAIGTFGAQHHLRQVLAYLDVEVMGQPEFYFNAGKAFDEKGECHDESTLKFARDYWAAFEKFLKAHEQTAMPKQEKPNEARL